MLCSVQNNAKYDFTFTSTSGNTMYINFRKSGFPEQIAHQMGTSNTGYGIFIGSGTKAENENDYFLENPILSGFQASLTTTTGVDNGSPYIQFVITITNTGSDTLTINELGLAQPFSCSPSSSGTNYGTYSILIDRTVLPSSVEIAPGDFDIIQYKLKTSLSN